MKTKRILAAMALMAAICPPAFSMTPAVKKSVPAVKERPNTVTVYITKRGKHFHKADCSKLNIRKTRSIKRYEALDKGYQPCKHCNP